MRTRLATARWALIYVAAAALLSAYAMELLGAGWWRSVMLTAVALTVLALIFGKDERPARPSGEPRRQAYEGRVRSTMPLHQKRLEPDVSLRLRCD